MPLEEIIARPITGIRPFNELPIDAEIWREAHEHHGLHRQLHAAGVHRPGIVWGLDVVASSKEPHTVVVAPGIAIDSDGQTLVLSEATSFALAEKGQIYITLSFLRTADRASAVTVGGGQQYYRVVEGRDVKATRELPKTPFLELSRLYRTGADKAVANAANPFDPASNELNGLHRRLAFPHCYADCAVGELSYVPESDPGAWKPNRAGLWNLLREGNGRGFHLDFSGPLNWRATNRATDPVLLYVAGAHAFQPLAEAELDGLRTFLAEGGMLMGEAVENSADFRGGFSDLATKLGADLKPVTREHPLLSAHHVFSTPPGGTHPRGDLLGDEAAGVLFSTYDYGGAWGGDLDAPDAANARERIRSAQEFGLNVIALAARRRRARELSRLS